MGYHLVEEIGEVAHEIREGNFEECRFEVADVFSWILSIANMASRRLDRAVSVEASLLDHY